MEKFLIMFKSEDATRVGTSYQSSSVTVVIRRKSPQKIVNLKSRAMLMFKFMSLFSPFGLIPRTKYIVRVF